MVVALLLFIGMIISVVIIDRREEKLSKKISIENLFHPRNRDKNKWTKAGYRLKKKRVG